MPRGKEEVLQFTETETPASTEAKFLVRGVSESSFQGPA